MKRAMNSSSTQKAWITGCKTAFIVGWRVEFALPYSEVTIDAIIVILHFPSLFLSSVYRMPSIMTLVLLHAAMFCFSEFRFIRFVLNASCRFLPRAWVVEEDVSEAAIKNTFSWWSLFVHFENLSPSTSYALGRVICLTTNTTESELNSVYHSWHS